MDNDAPCIFENKKSHLKNARDSEFNTLLIERLMILNRAIDEIHTEIGIRLQLSKRTQESMTESRRWVAGKIARFDDWQWGYKPSVDFRRTALEREIVGLYKEARSETQRTFADIAAMKKERRKLRMEYESLKVTQDALADI